MCTEVLSMCTLAYMMLNVITNEHNITSVIKTMHNKLSRQWQAHKQMEPTSGFLCLLTDGMDISTQSSFDELERQQVMVLMSSSSQRRQSVWRSEGHSSG